MCSQTYENRGVEGKSFTTGPIIKHGGCINCLSGQVLMEKLSMPFIPDVNEIRSKKCLLR